MIYLTFDIEEFDVPKEKGCDFSLKQGMDVSILGTKRILDILKKNNVCATLFCTSNFVNNASGLVKHAIDSGHEIASHGCDHWHPQNDDPLVSKKIIEDICNIKLKGYRQPRMFDVSDDFIKKCGYLYNSSLNHAFIPGKYAHLDIKRTAFEKDGVLQIPASVTPRTRVPLFWLSLHTFPQSLYFKMANSVLKKDGYFMTYFHPWEFVNHPKSIKKYMLPIVTHNSGSAMCMRLDKLIKRFKACGQEFATLSDFCDDFYKDKSNNHDAADAMLPRQFVN